MQNCRTGEGYNNALPALSDVQCGTEMSFPLAWLLSLICR